MLDGHFEYPFWIERYSTFYHFLLILLILSLSRVTLTGNISFLRRRLKVGIAIDCLCNVRLLQHVLMTEEGFVSLRQSCNPK